MQRALRARVEGCMMMWVAAPAQRSTAHEAWPWHSATAAAVMQGVACQRGVAGQLGTV
jgi:hypothetical protein